MGGVVRKCLGGCGRDVSPPASRCSLCLNTQRRARRHPGYDDPKFRAARQIKVGKACERCGTRPCTTVHHKDGNPGNNRAANLLGACSTCAHELDEEMRRARRSRIYG